MSFLSRPIREHWFRPLPVQSGKRQQNSSSVADPIGEHALARAIERIDDGKVTTHMLRLEIDGRPALLQELGERETPGEVTGE